MMKESGTTILSSVTLVGMPSGIRVRFPVLDVTMGSQRAATPRRGREPVRGNGTAARAAYITVTDVLHRTGVSSTTLGRGSQRDIVWANCELLMKEDKGEYIDN